MEKLLTNVNCYSAVWTSLNTRTALLAVLRSDRMGFSVFTDLKNLSWANTNTFSTTITLVGVYLNLWHSITLSH